MVRMFGAANRRPKNSGQTRRFFKEYLVRRVHNNAMASAPVTEDDSNSRPLVRKEDDHPKSLSASSYKENISIDEIARRTLVERETFHETVGTDTDDEDEPEIKRTGNEGYRMIHKMRFLVGQKMEMDHAYMIFGQEMSGKTEEERKDMLNILQDEKRHCLLWARSKLRRNILTKILKTGLEVRQGCKCRSLEDVRAILLNLKDSNRAREVHKILYPCFFAMSDNVSDWQLDFETVYMRKNKLVYNPESYYVNKTGGKKSKKKPEDCRGCIARAMSEARKEIMKSINDGCVYPIRTKRTAAMIRRDQKIQTGRRRTYRPKSADFMFVDLTNDTSDVDEYEEPTNDKENYTPTKEEVTTNVVPIIVKRAPNETWNTFLEQNREEILESEVSDRVTEQKEDEIVKLELRLEQMRQEYEVLRSKDHKSIEKLCEELGSKKRKDDEERSEKDREFEKERKKVRKNRQTLLNKDQNKKRDKNTNESEKELPKGTQDEGTIASDGESEDEEEERITKILKHNCTATGKYGMTILWNTGEKQTVRDLEVVAEDDWEMCKEYLEKVRETNAVKDYGFVSALLWALEKKAKNNHQQKYVTLVRKDIRVESTDDNPVDEMVDAEKHRENSRECSHKITDLELEENAMNCREGFKLHGRACADCSAKMVERGESEKYKQCKPGPSKGAMMCDNIAMCGYVLCNLCYIEQLGKQERGRRQR